MSSHASAESISASSTQSDHRVRALLQKARPLPSCPERKATPPSRSRAMTPDASEEPSTQDPSRLPGFNTETLPLDLSFPSYPNQPYPPPPSRVPPVVPVFANDQGDSSGTAVPPTPRIVEPLAPAPAITTALTDEQHSPPSDRASSRSPGRPLSVAGGLEFSASRSVSPSAALLGETLAPAGTEGKLKKRRQSWLPGRSQSRSPSGSSIAPPSPDVFIAGPMGRTEYDPTPLIRGEPIAELWDDEGNMLVYLYEGGRPSFRLHPSIIASSAGLKRLIRTTPKDDHSSCTSITPSELPLSTSSEYPGLEHSSTGSHSRSELEALDDETDEIHLQFPFTIPSSGPSSEDIESLVCVRNLFAFLVGQVVIGTKLMPTLFNIFNNIAGLLHQYEFTNIDGSTFGEAAEAAFLGYVADLALDDVRASREKTMEALVLGENMRCWSLYNEAYVHGVGKWDDMVQMQSPIFNQVSSVTKQRMEKSSMDLYIRLKGMRDRLDIFEFPSLFAGVAASKSAGKNTDFNAWKASWLAMRKHVLGFYKQQYGSWPPKANSKKNDFEESGLNRLLLQEVYQDFSDLYDILVDRKALTTRSVDLHSEDIHPNPDMDTLRKLLSEFDRSYPPVRPPVPYDLPLIPDVVSTYRDAQRLDEKERVKERSKRVKDDVLTLTLMHSYNRDSVKVTPFLESFMAFDRGSMRGKSIDEMASIRIGHWIFLYVVLQSLPLVVVDAPGLRWIQGVEYFLCEVPKGSPPWCEEAGHNKAYYRVAGSSGVVSLPADIVEHGVEGIFRRSHCWQVATEWSGHDQPVTTSTMPYGGEAATSYYPHPSSTTGSDGELLAAPTFLNPNSLGRTDSPKPNPRHSIMLGLEALPLPHGVMPTSTPNGTRKASAPDPTKSFDDILGIPEPTSKKKK